MKKLFKRITKSAAFHAIVVFLVAQYIRFVHYTSRRHLDMHESAKPFMRGDNPCIVSFWHGRLLMMPMIGPKKRKVNVLISTHRDGELIAQTMYHFGFDTIRGSTSRGGVAAAINAIRALRDGQHVAFTPDGPRGPAMKLQSGVITVATKANVPIIPMTFSSTRHKRAKSWDRFMVALPFGTIYYKIGAAMWNPTPEQLEAAMVAQTEEADSNVQIIS